MKTPTRLAVLAAAFVVTVAATGDRATYTVKQGDSLWRISEGALENPLLWPSIWKLNPYIKNPDLIYPGEIVTLPIECPAPAAAQEAAPTALAQETPAAVPAAEPAPKELFAYAPKVLAVSAGDPSVTADDRGAGLLRNQAPVFVGSSLPVTAVVLGSAEGATAMSPGMTLALDRGSSSGITQGQRLFIVHPDRQIFHPASGLPVGWLYRTVAEVRVDCLTADTASASIVNFFDIVSRGDLCLSAVPEVGEGMDLRPAFHGECVPGDPALTAMIVAPVNDNSAIVPGERIIIDRGAETGLNPGDRLLAIQDSVRPFASDRSEPATPKAIGEVVVLTTMPKLSTGILVSATRELTSGTSLILLR